MSEFDVIVIGGGPAGCYAALTAASKGCTVALFEEEGAIGWPNHCCGWLMESEFTESIVSAIGNKVPWIRVKEYRVYNVESGDLIENSKLGGYIVKRELLLKEIAALAIKAGANFHLKTRVTKLIRKDGKVEGVETNSTVIPSAKGEIFICADGIRSAANGFAVEEGLCERGKVVSGINYLLANADVSDGIFEHFLSSDPLLHYTGFFTLQKGVSYFGVPTSAAFLEIKERGDNIISRKIKNAYPIEINGFATASSGKPGKYFKNMVRDNIIFIGNASGGSGNIHAMIQGQSAGSVAASAIKEKDISEQRLSEYQDLVFNTLAKAPFYYFSAREDFGSFDNWFREFEQATKGMKATELTHLR